MPPKSAAAPAIPKKAPPPPQERVLSPKSSGMAAVMNELLGSDNFGLKRVTDDMKTKNRKDENGARVPSGQTSGHSSPPAPVGILPPVVLAPVCAIQRSNWVVENYVNHPGMLKLENCDMKQIVYISKCVNTTVYVDCKVKSIILDGCKRVNLIVNSVISSVELVNCERCKVHSVNELPSLAIDKCSGIAITLSPQSINCAFTSSKSSEMNVSVPVGNPDDGDYKEMPIPEQYVHTVTGTGSNARIETQVSGLYQ